MRKLKFSPSEARLYSLLPGSGAHVDTETLMQRFYPDPRKRPFNARVVVNNTLRSLIAKTRYMRDVDRVCRSAQNGPHSTLVWRAKRNTAGAA